MGCCSSTPSNSPSPSATHPYPNHSTPHATSSTPIAHASPSPPHTPSVPLPPSIRFNAPLRTHIYKAPPSHRWTPALLERERTAFFDTRVSGRPEVWSAVKLATESVRNGDIDTAQGVLDAAGCTVPTGDLCEGCYDEAGALYQLPGWVCADPIGEFSDHEERPKDKPVEEDTERGQEEEDADVVARREEKGKEREVRVGEGVKVKARLSDRASDVVVWIGKEEGARGVVRRVREEAGLDPNTKIRIAYMGKILRDNEPLLSQGWQEGHVVNALVF